jgi:hypothetical protein
MLDFPSIPSVWSTNSRILLNELNGVQISVPEYTSFSYMWVHENLLPDAELGFAEPELVDDRSADRAVHELRRLSGLTWDHLAKVFEVTRRTMHLWASGKPMNCANEAQLHRLIAFIHRIDRGEARRNRTALLSVRRDGVGVIELLRMSKYAEAEAVCGEGAGRSKRNSLTPLSSAESRAREPLAPGILMNARQDVIHKRSGHLVRERSRPIKRPK